MAVLLAYSLFEVQYTARKYLAIDGEKKRTYSSQNEDFECEKGDIRRENKGM
jgi:hypothetical protein